MRVLRERTSEDDEIRGLVSDDAVDEGGGVEVGAGDGLVREHVEAAGGSAVGVVHVGHLEYLELSRTTPLEEQARSRSRGSAAGSPTSSSSPSLWNIRRSAKRDRGIGGSWCED